ncbi:MAG TPA: Hsp20/alpha crystallin family protein [Candidatus Atribacteria bacterium]|nr:Hsp20/alpha crystallin family protein [Candidatus Atribacteria bacterium]
MIFSKKIKIEAQDTTSSKKRKQKTEKKEKQWFTLEGKLTVDVYETDSEIVVQSAIAGVKPQDLEISIENGILEIKGNRPNPEEKGNSKRNYFFQECWWGPFSRKIILPEEINNSQVRASMKEGILTIKIPKIKQDKRKRIRLRL